MADDAWTTKDGERIPWADLTDRHLLNIVRMLTRCIRDRRRDLTLHYRTLDDKIFGAARAQAMRRRGCDAEKTMRRNERRRWRRFQREYLRDETPKLARAFAEVEARGLFPMRADLCIAWDRVCGGTGGPDLSEDPAKRPWCLVELWVGFRGESTVSAEYAARDADIVREAC